MKRFYKLILITATTGLITLTVFAIGVYANRNTIRGVNEQSYLSAINDILSPMNTRFSLNNISVKDITYINDDVALVSVGTKNEGVTVYIVFELRDDHIYLTNYTSTTFSSNDFVNDSSETIKAIINSVGNK